MGVAIAIYFHNGVIPKYFGTLQRIGFFPRDACAQLFSSYPWAATPFTQSLTWICTVQTGTVGEGRTQFTLSYLPFLGKNKSLFMQMYLRRCIPDKSHLSFFHEDCGLCFREEVKRIVQQTSEVSESLSGLSSKNRFQVLNPLSRVYRSCQTLVGGRCGCNFDIWPTSFVSEPSWRCTKLESIVETTIVKCMWSDPSRRAGREDRDPREPWHVPCQQIADVSSKRRRMSVLDQGKFGLCSEFALATCAAQSLQCKYSLFLSDEALLDTPFLRRPCGLMSVQTLLESFDTNGVLRSHGSKGRRTKLRV